MVEVSQTPKMWAGTGPAGWGALRTLALPIVEDRMRLLAIYLLQRRALLVGVSRLKSFGTADVATGSNGQGKRSSLDAQPGMVPRMADQPVSGKGSSLEDAESLRNNLRATLDRPGSRPLVDIGCGNLMRSGSERARAGGNFAYCNLVPVLAGFTLSRMGICAQTTP